MMKQQNNMRLRKQFAAKANVVGPWIENQLDAVASMGIQTKSSLEEQLKKLRQYEQATAQYKPNIDELERYNQVEYWVLDDRKNFLKLWRWWLDRVFLGGC